MCTVERGNACKLFSSRTFKIDIVDSQAVPLLFKEALLLHPPQRCLAQIDARGVEMPVFSLMADNKHRCPGASAALEKIGDSVDQRCTADALSVHDTLQP